jgi:hypothetical protein
MEMNDEVLELLRGLIQDGHLVATCDVDGAAFHYVQRLTTKSDRSDVVVLWLDPVGLNHDLKTPMPADADC